MKSLKIAALSFGVLLAGTAFAFGQQAVKTNLTLDQQKLLNIQQQQLNQQNKVRPVEIVNHATFPMFNEREDMSAAAAEYDLAKKAWVEENREEYDKMIQESNTLLSPNN